ncbi:unnamed protein product, partial [Polarella glacialis]
EVAHVHTHLDHHPWGVTWPGHADKWGKEEPPMVDWDEIKDAFRHWNQFDYNIAPYFYGAVGLVAEVISSKIPSGGKAPGGGGH